MTETTPEFTLRDLNAIEARARALRAAAFARFFRGIGDGVLRMVHRLAHPGASRTA